MRRLLGLFVAIALVVTACNSQADQTTTSVDTTPTTAPTTTTTAPATTTTLEMQIEGADAELAALVRSVYEDGGPERPAWAQTSVGAFDETTKIAVVTASDDVTLAIADPAWRIVGGWWPSLGEEVSLGSFPKLMLVIGSDARPGHDPLSQQADSLHIVGLTEEGAATVVGVPRDAWLPVPDRGNMKITSSLLKGGPELTTQALSDASGIDFDGYLITGFEGFVGLIELLGGLDIDVPIDLADRWADAYIDAGPQVLSPSDALAFARVRKTIRGGDFTRKFHGGLALIAAATMVKSMGPEAIPGLLEAASGLYWTDLSPEEVLVLTAAIVRADIANATNIVADGTIGTTSGGASIVRLEDSAYVLFEDMRDGVLDNP